MMPIVNGLEEAFAGQIAVVRLDANDKTNAAWEREYGLRNHPSFLVLDANGSLVERFTGPQRTETLRAALERAIGTPLE
jgi:thioredoxin-like negative regulator of GroEL